MPTMRSKDRGRRRGERPEPTTAVRAARRAAAAALFGALAIAVACTTADAIDACRARTNRVDGSIRVFARGAVGTPVWGSSLGEERRAFDNLATCVSPAGQLARCTLGPVGTPERSTPPAGCVVFVADGAGSRCPALIRGCRPAAPPPLPCAVFPSSNVWNADVSSLPVHPMSATWVASIGGGASLHPDFGAGLWDGAPIGIPYTVVPAMQPLVPISFYYDDESDSGPYPIPPHAPVEGGATPGIGRGDRHVLVVERESCTLYEVYDAQRLARGAAWAAGSGAVWSLTSNALRSDGWTSADAAGLPILPGLVRYDEVAAGEIRHAIRVTAPRTQRAYVWPARHFASASTDPALPPMGIRLRLKASVDLTRFSPTNRIILTALERYGMLLADNGAPWFISGTPDERWDDDDLHQLATLRGTDFEVVDTASQIVDPDSGEAR